MIDKKDIAAVKDYIQNKGLVAHMNDAGLSIGAMTVVLNAIKNECDRILDETIKKNINTTGLIFYIILIQFLLISRGDKMALKNEIGNKYGILTVIERGPNTNQGRAQWVCECECGNIISVYSTNLVRLHTTSCGCANRSIGEENIENLLKENNITYAREYTFEDLVSKHRL